MHTSQKNEVDIEDRRIGPLKAGPQTPYINLTFTLLILTVIYFFIFSEECIDKIENCAAYGHSVCSGTYEAWAGDNCRKFCSFCGNENSHTNVAAQTVGGSGSAEQKVENSDVQGNTYKKFNLFVVDYRKENDLKTAVKFVPVENNPSTIS